MPNGHPVWPGRTPGANEHGALDLSYEIVYAPMAIEHLRGLDARERALVMDSIHGQLRHQPELATRNRKRLRPNPLASWELRIGELCVFYAVESSALVGSAAGETTTEGQVFVLAVGVKRANRLWLANEEYEL